MQRTAEAYTPAEFPADAGENPTVVVDVTHTPTSPNPKQGDPVDYSMTFTLDNMVEPGVTRSLTVTLYADPNAPFNSLPVASDFAFVNEAGSPVTVQGSRDDSCSTTSCTFTFTGMGDGTLTFTKSATIGADLGDGTLIMASANGKVSSNPTWAVNNLRSAAGGWRRNTLGAHQSHRLRERDPV